MILQLSLSKMDRRFATGLYDARRFRLYCLIENFMTKASRYKLQVDFGRVCKIILTAVKMLINFNIMLGLRSPTG